MATYKSKVLLDTLAADLALRLPVQAALGLTKAFDASSNPYLILGTNTTGTQSALVLIKGVTTFGTDIIGAAQAVFTPHTMQICFEASTIANVPYTTADIMLKLMGECLKFGLNVDIYLTANTVMPTAAVPGTLLGSFSPHIQYGLMSSM